jgi:hypothetical protein
MLLPRIRHPDTSSSELVNHEILGLTIPYSLLTTDVCLDALPEGGRMNMQEPATVWNPIFPW